MVQYVAGGNFHSHITKIASPRAKTLPKRELDGRPQPL